PWKERSRSAIERRVATNSARPSADRGPKHQGRTAPSQNDRGPRAFSSATKPFQSERGQSPRHDDLDRPWKERSRSAIERTPEKNRRGRAPAAAQDATVAGPRTRSAEVNQARAKPYVPKSSPRRGTSR